MGTSPKAPIDAEKTLRVRRGRVESVDLYEIKESELEILERGSPADLQLNFAVFLLSIAFGAICSLATATFANGLIQNGFLFVAVVGIFVGLYLLVAWYRNRTSTAAVCARIRSRIPPEGMVTSGSAGGDTTDDKKPAG